MTNKKRGLFTKLSAFSFLLPGILMASFPILSFFVNNMSELSIKFLEKPLTYSVAASLILALFIYMVCKNRQKTSLITSIILFIFFSYGHLSKFLNDKLFIQLPNKIVLGPDKLMLPILAVLLPYLLFRIIASKNKFEKTTIFISFPLIIIVGYLLTQITINQNKISRQKIPQEIENRQAVIQKTNTPDIYHIILDGYARVDILKKVYNYDNTPFLKNLEKMGFFVANKARSNYIHTYLSLPSTFNMTYLDFLPEKYGKKPLNVSAAENLMIDNLVSKKLKSYGYTTINFASGLEGTNEDYIADINYKNDQYLKIMGLNFMTSETNMVFLQTTLLSPLIKKVWGDALRARILTILEKLPDIPYKEEKKFILAHIMAPHPPYVFTKDGGVVPGSELENADEGVEKRPKYRDQLIFISDQIIPILQKLIANSKNPPIIILQADHGPASILGKREDWNKNYSQEGIDERSSILLAIYLPDQNYKEFYQTMTPVNIYRIIFNKYFNEALEILPDKTYYTSYDAIFNFLDVTNGINPIK